MEPLVTATVHVQTARKELQYKEGLQAFGRCTDSLEHIVTRPAQISAASLASISTVRNSNLKPPPPTPNAELEGDSRLSCDLLDCLSVSCWRTKQECGSGAEGLHFICHLWGIKAVNNEMGLNWV